MWLTFASHELHHSNLKKKQTERNSQGFHQLTVHHRNQWSFNMHWCIRTSSLYIVFIYNRQDIVRTYILTSTYIFTLNLSESCSTWVYQSLVTTKLTMPTSYILTASAVLFICLVLPTAGGKLSNQIFHTFPAHLRNGLILGVFWTHQVRTFGSHCHGSCGTHTPWKFNNKSPCKIYRAVKLICEVKIVNLSFITYHLPQSAYS